MATGKFISYLRVSTDRQGKSGLGLEAQRQGIEIYLNGGNWQLLKEFVEVESGKKNDRPQLKAALDACQSTGATLLIAKLDRLARNVAFISNLMESGVEFVACDFPQANRLTIHILAAVAEHEREMISKRTKEALAAAKARKVQLGNPDNFTDCAAKKGRKLGTKFRMAKADEFARKRYPYIRKMMDEGLTLRGVARRLNQEEVLTARGHAGKWTPTAVSNVIGRAESLAQVS
jgi:DNA invertase Pin-like site-specific DNA recombinase